MSEHREEFQKALHGKKVPILILDQKWHRLFAIQGKPDNVAELESKLSGLLARQGKLTNEVKDLKKLKNRLMDNIVQNMDGASDSEKGATMEKKLDEDREKIDETNAKIEELEDELLDLPNQIKSVNETLMLESMDYIAEIFHVNKQEADEIEQWINQVRIDLKKNIIRKQNRDINNREMYSYLHDILGPEVLDLFDFEYSGAAEEEEENK